MNHALGSTPIVVAHIDVALIATILSSNFWVLIQAVIDSRTSIVNMLDVVRITERYNRDLFRSGS